MTTKSKQTTTQQDLLLSVKGNKWKDVFEILKNDHSLVNMAYYGGPGGIQTTLREKWTLIHEAALRNKYREIKKLYQLGGDICAIDEFGSTPLHIACLKSHLHTVCLLIKLGAKIDLPNKFGSTPLYMTCHERANGYLDVCVLLISLGCDMNYRNLYGDSPISKVERFKRETVINRVNELISKRFAIAYIPPMTSTIRATHLNFWMASLILSYLKPVVLKVSIMEEKFQKILFRSKCSNQHNDDNNDDSNNFDDDDAHLLELQVPLDVDDDIC